MYSGHTIVSRKQTRVPFTRRELAEELRSIPSVSSSRSKLSAELTVFIEQSVWLVIEDSSDREDL